MNNKNNRLDKNMKYLIMLSVLLLLAMLGTSFSYFSARMIKINETTTNIKTNELGLIYTGVGEIDYSSVIPGDRFIKTFSVHNMSNVDISYNVYYQNITNEFNEDLVYTLIETDAAGNEISTIVSETALPATNLNKSYLKENLQISTNTTKYYTLKIEYKYTNISQNNYQGKRFIATLGIDSNAL